METKQWEAAKLKRDSKRDQERGRVMGERFCLL